MDDANNDFQYSKVWFQDDVADFLDRVNILGGHRGIILTTDDRGRPSGDAYVEVKTINQSQSSILTLNQSQVETIDDVDLALKMNKRDMGSRWVVGRDSDGISELPLILSLVVGE